MAQKYKCHPDFWNAWRFWGSPLGSPRTLLDVCRSYEGRCTCECTWTLNHGDTTCMFLSESFSLAISDLLLFCYSSVLWFCYKEGSGVGRTTSFLLLFQLIKSFLIMKFAFALLPIAAALRFVVAGPVAAEGLVCASMFSSRIYRVHY